MMTDGECPCKVPAMLSLLGNLSCVILDENASTYTIYVSIIALKKVMPTTSQGHVLKQMFLRYQGSILDIKDQSNPILNSNGYQLALLFVYF